MSAITTFLQSDQALKILGLPGFALLLAFVFYRTLVANRVVRPIGRNQSFIVLVLIIIYFLVVSCLVIWVYRPERAPATTTGLPAGKIEEPSLWSKVDNFFARTELDTPLATFDSTLGPATGDSAIAPDTTNLRKRNYFTLQDGLMVTVGHDGSSVQWLAAYDNGQRLRIPTLHMGFGDDPRIYERLSDLDLTFVVDHCREAKVEVPGRGGIYAISPCYFGRPGGYNNFAFIFETSEAQLPLDGPCSPSTQAEEKFTMEKVNQCRIGNEKPFGFIIAGDEALLPTAVTAFIETLDN